MSTVLIAYLESKETARKLTMHDTPQENGVSECLNHTLMEKVQAMLWATGLPHYLWGEALLHAMYLKNHTFMKALNGHTPYEAVNEGPLNLQDLPKWGCKVWVHNDEGGKVGIRAKKGHWVGYDEHSKGHHIYWPDKQSVGVERNIKFSETYVPVPHNDDVVLEGKDENLDESTPMLTQPEPPVLTPVTQPVTQPAMQPEVCSTRIRKPFQYIRDVQDGKGSAQGLKNQPAFPHGMPIPEARIKEVDDEVETKNLEGELVEEIHVVMAAKMAEAHGLEPQNVKEVMRSPR